ncbi:hypothetical protein AAG587_01965 [Vreelandella neptunia]|uniref:hypothetical protein n=1 Tax=Vreelandella neptunia TaxID=115551 RepID=UPI00315AABB1
MLNHFLPALLPIILMVGGTLGWSFNTLCSAVIGFWVGSVLVGVVHLVPSKEAHVE